MTSTGTGVSTAVREVRAPTTTISLRARGVAVSLKSTVTVCPAGTTTRCSAASCPMSRARTLCTPAGTLRRYCPFSWVRTLRAVPTTTTLAPTSGAHDFGWVRHAPVRQDRLAGEDGTRFLGSIAHRDHEVPRLALQPVDAAGSVPGPGDVVVAQRLDRVKIHAIGGA